MANAKRGVVDLTGDSSDDEVVVTKVAKTEAVVAWRVLKSVGVPEAANEWAMSFREMVGAGKRATFVLISNFMIDPTFLLTAWPELLDPTRCPRVVILYGDTALSQIPTPAHIEKQQMNVKEMEFRHPVSGKVWKNDYGCHHSKFFIVGYPDGVHVAISTANDIYPDVYEKSQGVWTQFFPMKIEAGSSDFEDSLCDYVVSLEAHAAALTRGPWGGNGGGSAGLSVALRRYDFSGAKAHLVPVVPGYHLGQNKDKYGQARVARLLARSSSLSSSRGGDVVMQFSSCASTKSQYIDQLLRSFGGQGPLKVVWPTVDEVRCSVGGFAAGASLPARPENVAKARGHHNVRLNRWSNRTSSSSFVKARAAASPHIKTVSRFNATGSLDYSILSSSNISTGAWGELQKNNTQLFCKNWELGLLVTPESLGVDVLATTENFRELQRGHNRVGLVPLPFPTRPLVPYGSADTPWDSAQSSTMTDNFGATSLDTALIQHYDRPDPNGPRGI